MTGITGKNKKFLLIFAYKSFIVFCDKPEWVLTPPPPIPKPRSKAQDPSSGIHLQPPPTEIQNL